MTLEQEEPRRDEAAVAAYLGNYLTRLRRDGGDSVFPAAEANAVASLFLADLHDHVQGEVATAALAADYTRVSAGAVRIDSPDASFNMAAVAWLSRRSVDGEHDVASRILEIGGSPEALPSLVAMAWRALFLARWPESTPQLEEERSRHIGRLVGWAQSQRALIAARSEKVDLQVLARIAYVGSLLAEELGDPALREAAQSLTTGLWELRSAGPLPGKQWVGVASSSMLAQVLLGAFATNEEQLVEAVRADLHARVDDGRHLLRHEDEGEKYEFSPWVPLALLRWVTRSASIDDVLDPQAIPLPSFEIAAVTRRPDGIAVDVRDSGQTFTRLVSDRDLNLLLDRILRTVATKETSPRQHAHMIVALDELEELEPASATRDAIDHLINRSIRIICSEQQPNGGWFYGHKGVPSVVYTAGKRNVTEFPDYQYTIDAAVPGVALCVQYKRTGEQKFVERAARALAFFEETVGRVEWNGRSVWRLYPEDDKTQRMGTAVNYELWAGYFFAWLLSVDPDHPRAGRLRGYLTDIVAYSAGHLEDNGDIAYGDYVDEKRSAYASWDAFLLREIGTRADMPDAVEMSDRIVSRLGELTLPSGVVPNVSDYFETVGEHQRWAVHRHGIGPYPVRAYYQFYFAVAGSSTDASRSSAARAMAYTLVDLYEPTTGNLGPGFAGRGEQDVRPGVTARDWAVLTLAALPRLAAAGYHPDHEEVDSVEGRLEQLFARLSARAAPGSRAQDEDHPGPREATLWWARAELARQHEDQLPEAIGQILAQPDDGPLAPLAALARLDAGLPIDRVTEPGSPDDLVWTAQALAVAARDGDPAAHEHAEQLLSTLGDANLIAGADGDLAAAHLRALLALLEARCLESARRALDAAVRPAVKELWSAYFGRRGEGFLDREHQTPMPADDQALAALLFRRAGQDLRSDRMLDFADKATLYTFLAHRTVHGAPGVRDSRDPDAQLREARVHYALAAQGDALVEWLQRETASTHVDLLRA